MANVTIQELFDKLPETFVSEKAAGINSTIQFTLSGTQGGEWWVEIMNNECKVTKGSIENPKLSFDASAQDCLDIFTGKLDGVRAYMQGKLKLKGDFGLAMKLTGLFDPAKTTF